LQNCLLKQTHLIMRQKEKVTKRADHMNSGQNERVGGINGGGGTVKVNTGLLLKAWARWGDKPGMTEMCGTTDARQGIREV